jgi:hypothetical protein
LQGVDAGGETDRDGTRAGDIQLPEDGNSAVDTSEKLAGSGPTVDAVATIRRQIREQLGRNDRKALALIADGLKLRPDDAEFQRGLDEMLRSSEAAASRARTEATHLTQRRGPDLAVREYQQGLEKQHEAQRLRGRQKQDATLAFWAAADLFTQATVRAKSAQSGSGLSSSAQSASADVAAVYGAQQNSVGANGGTPTGPVAGTNPGEGQGSFSDDQRAADQRAADQRAAEQRAAEQRAADQRAAEEKRIALSKQDELNIRSVLDRYVTAYNSLDAAALAPLVSTQLGARIDFSAFRYYRLALDGPRIQIAGDTATVSCIRRIEAEVKRGNVTMRQAPETTFVMRRSGDSWIIENVR